VCKILPSLSQTSFKITSGKKCLLIAIRKLFFPDLIYWQNRLYGSFDRGGFFQYYGWTDCKDSENNNPKEEKSMRARSIFLVVAVALAVYTGAAYAQQRGQVSQPALMECGASGDVEIICGTHLPEDLEPAPDDRFLIVSHMAGRASEEGGIALYDPAKKNFSEMPITVEPLKDWGDPSCPGPADDMLSPHGMSFSRRSSSVLQLYVVNHGGRESIEMYEVKQGAATWGLVWHGCVVAKNDYNDVAALPDGSFVATHPNSLRIKGSDLVGGQPSGVVARWTPGKGETELPGTKAGYPNGVVADSGGRYIYYAAWTAREVHKYDLSAGRDVSVIKLDFMPDNLTWTKKGQILAAGIKGVQGDCPAGSGAPCMQGFGVAVIDPAKMQVKTVFDSHGKGALISGVSVALQVKDSVYIGSFQGNRILRLSANCTPLLEADSELQPIREGGDSTVEELEERVKALETRLGSLEGLAVKVRTLEDTEAIKILQRAYGFYLEHMMVEDIVDLFADGEDVELWVSAGKFKGKDAIRRLYQYIRDAFPSHEFLHQLMQLSGIVHVNPDGMTANGRWYGFGAQALPMRGGKINPGWMNGVYETEYLKQDGKWKIRKLRWTMTFRASWTQSFVEPSRRDDSQMDRAENPNLQISDKAEETRYPSGFICPFHFENPVSGRRTVVEGQPALSPDEY
jgi:hypothetical protein